jgi:OpgC protein
LSIYCLGVLLSLAAHVLLMRFSGGVAAQVAVSAVGILILVAFATLSTWIGIGSRRQPKLL